MHANLLARAIGKIKTNPSKSSHTEAEKAEESKSSATDILSRIKKPNKGSSELVIKDPVGGKELRQEKRAPYSSTSTSATKGTAEAAKNLLGGRFVPKAELTNQLWKHDLCPVQVKPQYRVFVRSLPADVSNDMLKRVFEKHGEITGIRINKDTADIYYSTKFAAQKAATSEAIVKGKKVKITFADEAKKAYSEESEETEKVTEDRPALVSDTIHRDPQSILARIKKANPSQ